MKHTISMQQLREYLLELVEWDSLEVALEPVPGEVTMYHVHIPYLMNDAVEKYLTLVNCSVLGDVSHKIEDVVKIETTASDQALGLIIRRDNGEVINFWFQQATEKIYCYQYHRIGHFWIEGQEQWRQLVYGIGTIYEKYCYVGAGFCNEMETWLMPLVTFPPFRYWTPLDEELSCRYPDSTAGYERMLELAVEAGDLEFAGKIRKFHKKYRSPFGNKTNLVTEMAQEFLSPQRRTLYDLLLKKFCLASKPYPLRGYHPEVLEQMELQRRKITRELQGNGYQGSYPFFYKEGMALTAFEEHPYLRSEMEYQGFTFQIQILQQTFDESHWEIQVGSCESLL